MLEVPLTKTYANGQYIVLVRTTPLVPLVRLAASLLVKNVFARLHWSCRTAKDNAGRSHDTRETHIEGNDNLSMLEQESPVLRGSRPIYCLPWLQLQRPIPASFGEEMQAPSKCRLHPRTFVVIGWKVGAPIGSCIWKSEGKLEELQDMDSAIFTVMKLFPEHFVSCPAQFENLQGSAAKEADNFKPWLITIVIIVRTPLWPA